MGSRTLGNGGDPQGGSSRQVSSTHRLMALSYAGVTPMACVRGSMIRARWLPRTATHSPAAWSRQTMANTSGGMMHSFNGTKRNSSRAPERFVTHGLVAAAGLAVAVGLGGCGTESSLALT